jgi:TRAP-type C4-dicarboxylate transport system substrate-binding protein
MGDEEDYIEKVRVNQLQGAMVTASGGITEAVCPDMAVLQLPFLFNPWAWDEVKYVRDNIRDELFEMAKKRGYKIIIFMDLDFEQLYSTKYKIDSLESLQKAKVLTHAGRLEDLMLRSLGISPVPVNVPEVVSSVRTGIINVAISPSLWWVGAQLYPVTKYVNPLPIKYAPGLMVLSLEAWEKLSEKNRQAISNVLPGLEEEANVAIKDCNEKSYKAMVKYGVKEIHLSEKEMILFKKKTRPLWDEMAGDIYSREILDKVMNLLKEYRTKRRL